MLDWPQRAGATEEVLAELNHLGRRRRHLRLGLAGAGIAAALVFLVWPAGRERLVPVAAPAGIIAVDAPAQQRLDDGTLVDLQEGAVVEAAYTVESRRVVLRQGTAHFQVTKDAARPFVVEADGLRVRAVGTAFSVVQAPAGVEVIVTEGRVAVAADSNGPVAEAWAEAGECVRAGSGADSALAVRPVSAAELAERMAWRLPRLRFTDAPLAEAVALINRHNRRQLVIDDATLGELQISGVLRADNQAAFLEALRMNFGIEAIPVGDDEIHLRRRTAAVIN